MALNYRFKFLFFLFPFVTAGDYSPKGLTELIKERDFRSRMEFLGEHTDEIELRATEDMNPDQTFDQVLKLMRPNNKKLFCLETDLPQDQDEDETKPEDRKNPILEKKKHDLIPSFKKDGKDWADLLIDHYNEFLQYKKLLEKGEAGMFACESVFEEVINGNEKILNDIFFAWCLRNPDLLPESIKNSKDWDFIKSRVEKVRWFNLFAPQITGRLAYHLATAWDYVGPVLIIAVPTLLIVGMVYWSWSLWWISLIVLFNPAIRFWLMFPKFCMGWDMGQGLMVKFLAMLLSEEIKYKDEQLQFSSKINAGPFEPSNLLLLDAWSSSKTSCLNPSPQLRKEHNDFIEEINEKHKQDPSYSSYEVRKDRENPVVVGCILQTIKNICKDASADDLRDPESEKAKTILGKLERHNISVGKEDDVHSQLMAIRMALYFTTIIERPRFGILSYIPIVSQIVSALMTFRVCKYFRFLNFGWWVFQSQWRFSGCSFGRCISGWSMFCLFDLIRKKLSCFEYFST